MQEAWQAVFETYLDPSFRGVDWASLEPAEGADPCADAEGADVAVRTLLSHLGDPAVRLVPGSQVPGFMAEMLDQPRVGVGLRELLSVDVDEGTHLLTVVTPVPDGPAARAGIRTGDVLAGIDGEPTANMDLALAMARLRGEEGTTVEVTVRRGGDTETVELQRESIPPTPGPVLRLREHADGPPVAYVRVADFSEGTAAGLAEVLRRAEAGGAGGLVLDLRDNPGGLVAELTGAAELFLEPGTTIARLEARDGEDTVFVAEGPRATDLQTVVLVNGGTASAAEALAGALQAAGRAPVVGEMTFGKGLAHFSTRLSDGSLVLVPGGRLRTPHGRDILDQGVAPDVRVPGPPLSTLLPAPGEDEVYRKAVGLLGSPAGDDPSAADSADTRAAPSSQCASSPYSPALSSSQSA